MRSLCGRSGKLADADDDLLYLKKLDKYNARREQ